MDILAGLRRSEQLLACSSCGTLMDFMTLACRFLDLSEHEPVLRLMSGAAERGCRRSVSSDWFVAADHDTFGVPRLSPWQGWVFTSGDFGGEVGGPG